MIFSLRILAMILGFSFCLGAGFGGDIVPRGQKGVKHELAFSNLAAFSNYDFYLLMPEGWDREPIRLRENEPCSFYKFLTGRLVAVPSGEVPNAENLVASAARTFGLNTLASSLSPVASRLSQFKIERVLGDQIEVADLGTLEFDADGQLLAPGPRIAGQPVHYVLLVILGGLGLFLLALKRRRTSLSTAVPE